MRKIKNITHNINKQNDQINKMAKDIDQRKNEAMAL